MNAEVVPIPLWLHPRRTGILLAVLGTLILLFGLGLMLDSADLERQLERELRPSPAPPESTSSPTSTSS